MNPKAPKIIFYPPSPGSVLASRLKKVAREEAEHSCTNIKVVERCGISLKSQLPGFKSPVQCRRDCIVNTNDGKGACTKPGAVYMGQYLTCKNEGPISAPLPDGGVQVLDDSERHPCKSIYIGETSFSAFHRGLKHVESMSRPQTHQSNAFAKHQLEYRQGNDAQLSLGFSK